LEAQGGQEENRAIVLQRIRAIAVVTSHLRQHYVVIIVVVPGEELKRCNRHLVEAAAGSLIISRKFGSGINGCFVL